MGSYIDGRKNTRLYAIYLGIKARCYNKKYRDYSFYGNRGISMCDEWLNDFVTFRNWASVSGYKDTMCIDRIDNNDNYKPDNCRWTTRGENTSKRDLEHSKIVASNMNRDYLGRFTGG